MISKARLVGAFIAAFLSACIATSATMILMAPNDPHGSFQKLIVSFAALTLLSSPVILITGLIAVMIERLRLRDVGDLAYFVAALLVAAVASVVAEQAIFVRPYVSFGAFTIPAVAAGLVAAVVWRQLVRKNERSLHA